MAFKSIPLMIFEGKIPVLLVHPDATPDHVGVIPTFLNIDDPRKAAEQFDEHYGPIGGGWRPQEGFTKGATSYSLSYPGDPDLVPFAYIPFRAEKIYIYDYGYVAIWQSDDSFEACRMD